MWDEYMSVSNGSNTSCLFSWVPSQDGGWRCYGKRPVYLQTHRVLEKTLPFRRMQSQGHRLEGKMPGLCEEWEVELKCPRGVRTGGLRPRWHRGRGPRVLCEDKEAPAGGGGPSRGRLIQGQRRENPTDSFGMLPKVWGPVSHQLCSEKP